MTTKATVATVACQSYDDCLQPVRRALTLSGILPGISGRKVFLKPNMMKGFPYQTPEATHPLFAGAVVRVLVENGCVVSAGDSSGILGFTTEVMNASGMTAAVIENGGTVVNLDAGPFEHVDLGGEFSGHRMPVSRVLFDADAVLDLPKMKTHTFLGLTLSVKNFVGVFPGAVKCGLHTLAPDRERFATLVSGIPAALEAAGVKLAGSIVDGILAMGGRGGNVPPAPTLMNFVAAGLNLFDVDLVCATIGGFDPSCVPLCEIGSRRGLGAARVEDVQIVGDRIERTNLPPAGRDLQESNTALTSAYYRIRGNLVKPVFRPDLCSACDKCVQVCPVGCIIVRAPRDRIIGPECSRCLACRESCPTGAIGLAANTVLKPFLKKRAAGLDMNRLL